MSYLLCYITKIMFLTIILLALKARYKHYITKFRKIWLPFLKQNWQFFNHSYCISRDDVIFNRYAGPYIFLTKVFPSKQVFHLIESFKDLNSIVTHLSFFFDDYVGKDQVCEGQRGNPVKFSKRLNFSTSAISNSRPALCYCAARVVIKIQQNRFEFAHLCSN